MEQVGTIGLDIAKRVFQVHGVDAPGEVIFRRQLRRAEMVKFFAKLRPARWGWRRALRGITGAARLPPWAIGCG